MSKIRPLIPVPKRELKPKTGGCDYCNKKKELTPVKNNTNIRIRGGRIF